MAEQAKRSRSKKPEATYHWKAQDSVSKGARRIVREQLQLAIWQLSKNTAHLDEAVHEARKSIKKIRSALRLVESILGPEYREAKDGLRDASGKLSPLRDAQALIQTFDELNGKYRDKLGGRSLVSVRDGLVSHEKQLAENFRHKRVAGSALKSLRDVAAHMDQWHPVKVDFSVVSKAFADSIRRNRKACDHAYHDPQPDAFHEWRKRLKDLRYHLTLLRKAWPLVLDGYLEGVKDLEQRLGDHQNLTVLRDTILKSPGQFGKEADISALFKIVEEHQQQLRTDSKSLAARLYAEKPKEWRRRLDACWSAWKADA